VALNADPRRGLRVGDALAAGAEAIFADRAAVIVAMLVGTVLSLVTVGIALPAMLAGYHLLVLRALRGEPVAPRDLREGWALAKRSLLVKLPFFAAFVAIALPGGVVGALNKLEPGLRLQRYEGPLSIVALVLSLPLAVGFVWAYALLADGHGAGACLKLSVRAVARHLAGVMWFGFVAALVAHAGALMLLIGLVVSTPLAHAMVVHGYLQVMGAREEPVGA
jgi:uncharacterized membrane protein